MRGVPGNLPADERLLWQASPNWRRFAVAAMPLSWIGLYVVALVAWCAAAGAWNVAAAYAMIAGAALFIMAVIGAAMARSTTYSLTSRHIVIEYGFALPKTVTIPLSRVANVALRTNRDGSGDVAIRLDSNRGLSSALLWPHVRLARLRAEPVLRAIPAAETAGAMLARALAAGTETLPAARPAAPVAVPEPALAPVAA